MESNSIECSESICNWCKKKISDTASEFSTAHDGFKYCSESCFAQNRRASFKKAKTCDWCKHIRHTVNYVDFQDGASQLQFCSDKCLNQYKMQLFCKETQAHLDMNPHLKEKGVDKPESLITPELSASPSSSLSSRNTPQLNNRTDINPEKPLITVTNIQKLIDESNHYIPPVNKRKLMKSRKRRTRLSPTEPSILPTPEHQHYNSEPIRPCPPTLPSHQGSQPNFNILPPITVMVPYPVIIPLPIPVPIPDAEEEVTQEASPGELVEAGEESVVAEERQMIPKLKITRLQSRRITESSRPLRKRKLVNSEYLRVLSSSKNSDNDLNK
uniref:TRASH domain-containing protein n=1 Tax=Megaselia scalaris TaxID=36166 RepID=T1GWX4_MEGSC